MNLKNMKRSEDTEQIAVFDWAEWNRGTYPELKWLHHCPNGGKRGAQEAARFKRMGVKAGVSDICLPYPHGIYCGLYIEMKYGTNRQQESQKEFLKDMEATGHFVATCYSGEEAIQVIKKYLDLPASGNYIKNLLETIRQGRKTQDMDDMISKNTMSIPNNSVLKGGKVL